jgi:glucose-1-phosphate cytidylyltransferase
VRVLILCGGLGTRLREETEFKPKPLVEIGGRPILWHIMKSYAQHGYRDFVLLLGYKGELIKRYFLDYHLLTRDVTVKLGSRESVQFHAGERELDWTVTMVDTGARSMTGARVARAARWVEGDRFMLTYGDGVSDVDLKKLEEFHLAHGKLATVTGVRPPARFGDLIVEGDQVNRFAEKPASGGGHINGGFFVFERAALDYLSQDETCALEGPPLERLATDGQLKMFAHDGYWHPMDTLRDVGHLNELWAKGSAPWKSWADEP